MMKGSCRTAASSSGDAVFETTLVCDTAHTREQVFMTVILHDQSHDQSLDRSSISLLRTVCWGRSSQYSLSDFMLLNSLNFFRNCKLFIYFQKGVRNDTWKRDSFGYVRLVNSPHRHGLLPAYYLLKSIAFDFILFHLTLFVWSVVSINLLLDCKCSVLDVFIAWLGLALW